MNWCKVSGNEICTMQVLDFSPINESRRTCVSFEARKGRWAPLRPKARIHSLRAKRDLLISAPSIPVIETTADMTQGQILQLPCWKISIQHHKEFKRGNSRVWRLADDVSAPRSLPAKSTKENLPCNREFGRVRKIIWKTACEREEWALADVWPEVRTLLPCWINLSTSSTESTERSHRPTSCTCCLPSSSTRNLALPFKRSKTCETKILTHDNGSVRR